MKDLIVCETSITRDTNGLYCLNDLHRAAGKASRHQPGKWEEIQSTAGLITLLEGENATTGIPVIQSKQRLGTFACKELVYSYAMWISPEFHLHVIRAYDKMVASAPAPVVQDPTLRAVMTLLLETDKIKQEQTRQALQIQTVETRLDQIATAVDYFTILGWASATNYGHIPLATAQAMGKAAAAYCKANGVSMGTTPDARYGAVKTYPRDVLDELFAK